MHNTELILTITCSLGVSLVLGFLTHRLGLSTIVGYLLAGIALGPNTPGFVADRHLADQLAEIGVILLMFGVGLHFHLEELLAVRRVAIPGAIVQSLIATLLGIAVAMGLGWGWAAGLVYGLAISVASTVVMSRVLTDHNELHTHTGHIAIGWLVVEDLFTVIVLVMLPVVFGERRGDVQGMMIALSFTTLKIVGLLALTFPVGGRVIPWLLNRVANTGSRELFTLTILAVALGIAVGSMLLFGVSMALGAFLAGMIVGRSEFSLRAAADALPMRDAFAVLFFVSVGMLFDPNALIDSPVAVIATVLVVMIGKPLAALGLVLFLRYPTKTAVAVAVSLGQIGEFSFILGSLGTSLKVLPVEATNAMIAAAIVSISLNPLLFRSVDRFDRWLLSKPKLHRLLNARSRVEEMKAIPLELDSRFRAVVVGYGPVGKTLVRLLMENEMVPVVIEMNLDSVRYLRGQGVNAIYGDASHRETLKESGIQQSAYLVLSSSGMKGAEEVVRSARELNPEIRVLARSSYLSERTELRRVGADEVYAGEGEVALAMTESMLRTLGASPEQIDRERERVRTELFGQNEGSPLPLKRD